MQKLQVFDFDESPIRVIERDGEPWFVAADVCRLLELTNTAVSVAKLDEDERAAVSLTYSRSKAGAGLTDTSSNCASQSRRVSIINESGLYTLILRSRDATTPGTISHRFRKWVTADVLPSIRKTGRYEAACEDDCAHEAPAPRPALTDEQE